MPTIKIVSIGAKKLGLNAPDFSLAIIEESVLKSHRDLFNDFLSKHSGIIVHLGDPDFKKDQSFFFADELIDWKSRPLPTKEETSFAFSLNTRVRSIRCLGRHYRLLRCNALIFLADIQQGEEDAHHFAPEFSLEDFWQKHEAYGLGSAVN